MSQKKVLMMVRAYVRWELLEQFNEHWEKNSLPNWIKNGARHIGSYTHYLGGPKNEIIRIFEFDDFTAWEKFMDLRIRRMADPLAGSKVEMQNRHYLETLEETILISVY